MGERVPEGNTFCTNISHLIYKLHKSRDYKDKFLLLTHIPHFYDKVINSEETCLRLLMSIDPEFIYLMIRSSDIFANIALELSNLLLCSRKVSRHMVKLLPYIRDLLCRISDGSSILDSSSKIITKRMEFKSEHLWVRLVYESLTAIKRIIKYLGPDAIRLIEFDLVEMDEPLDLLLKDMFDIAIDEDDHLRVKNDMIKGCSLCNLRMEGEFKDEAIAMESLFNDLDALVDAHLEDLERSGWKSLSCDEEDDEVSLYDVIKKIGNTLLSELKIGKFHDCKNVLLLYLSCLELVFELLPGDKIYSFFDSCLNSDNFDVLRVMTDYFSDNFDMKCIIPMSQHLINLLNCNLSRDNLSILFQFFQKVLQRHGLVIFEDKCVNSLVVIIKRIEIEIHLTLDDFFRNLNSDSGSSFQLLETLLILICDFDDATPEPLDELFAILHRIINVMLDFYKQIDDNNKEKAKELINCCSRLIGCWMTLEPLHFQEKYVKSLNVMLSVMSELDVTWTLTTMDYIDIYDLSNVDMLVGALLAVLLKSARGDYEINDEITKEHFGNRTIFMISRILEKLFLNPIVDYLKILKSLCQRAKYNLIVPSSPTGSSSTTSLNSVNVAVSSGDPPSEVVSGCIRKVKGKDNGQGSTSSLLMEPVASSLGFSMSYPVELLVPIVHDLADISRFSEEYMYTVRVVELLFNEKVKEYMKLGFIESENQDVFLKSLKGIEGDCSLLSNITLLIATVTLSRVKEEVALEYLEQQQLELIHKCVIFTFFYSSPKIPDDYLSDTEVVHIWYRNSKLTLLLLQNHPTFKNAFIDTIKKVGLRLPRPSLSDMECLVNDEYLNREDVVITDFFYRFLSRICS